MSGSQISNFEHIMEAMPFKTEHQKLVFGAMFCRQLAGCTIVVPIKQPERELAKEMFKKGVDFDLVNEAVSLNKRTLRKIQLEVEADG